MRNFKEYITGKNEFPKEEKIAKDIIYDVIYGNMIVTAKGDPKQVRSLMFGSDFKVNVMQYFTTKFSANTFEIVKRYLEENYKFTDRLNGRWKGIEGILDIKGEEYHISMGNKGQKMPHLRVYLDN